MSFEALCPRYTRTYNGSTQIGGTNETIYHDEIGNSWVKNKAQIDDSHYAETTTYFDGLGRAHKSESLDSGGNVFVEKEFDADGRVSRKKSGSSMNLPCESSAAISNTP